MTEATEAYKVRKSKFTRIKFWFGSPKVTVEKEVWSYSTRTFVAECGGLLGLFIGFNFVMIWDLIVIVYQKIKSTF